MQEISSKEYLKDLDIKLEISTGYLYFKDCKSHLAIGNSCKVRVHRFLAEILVGRPLEEDEHVHHIDGNRINNEFSNLQVLSASEHSILHHSMSGDSLTKEIKCLQCDKLFWQKESTQKFCSVPCVNKYRSLDKTFLKDPTITKELLDSLIPTNTWVALGKMFGYSDNGIKKRAIALGCNLKELKPR